MNTFAEAEKAGPGYDKTAVSRITAQALFLRLENRQFEIRCCRVAFEFMNTGQIPNVSATSSCSIA